MSPSPSAAPVQGDVASGWEGVRELFARHLERGEEWGGALCVWYDGDVVVDIWGGHAHRHDGGTPWTPDHMVNLFSVTKGLVGLCFLMLEDRDQVDLDAPVARWWPEFAQGGKDAITIRQVLNHRAGLIGLDEPLTVDMIAKRSADVERILAAQRPHWVPGSAQGYHGVTYGLYTQEIFRRVAGVSLGGFLRREVTGPLGADVHLGLPADLDDRVATTYPSTTAERLLQVVPKLLFHTGTDGQVFRRAAFGGHAAKAFAHPKELGLRGIARFNHPEIRALELPWANAIGSARGLCRVYSALAAGGELDGVRLVDEAALERVRPRQSWADVDRVLRKPLGWSQGFLKEEAGLFSATDAGFGHAGAGGALGWCDPEQGLAIGYTPNKMDHRIRSRRAKALCGAIQAAAA